MLSIFARKKSWRWMVVLFGLFLFSSEGFSQTDYRTDNDYNRDSRSLILALNTNGYRLGFRFSKRVDGFRSNLLDIDLAWYRHYKEKTFIFSAGSQSKYSYGKLNQLILLRTSVGREKELYGKYAKSGVAVLLSYHLGASVGFLKPYYLIDNQGNGVLFKDMKNPSVGFIRQRAPFTKGFDELKFAFGAHAQIAFAFDINRKHKKINNLELGATFDFFHRKLPIFANVQQHHYILTLFIAYRFGKKIKDSIN